jgi:hypothetical protein
MEPASNTDEGFCVACAKILAMDDEGWWGASCGHDFCWTCIEALLRCILLIKANAQRMIDCNSYLPSPR